MLTSLLFHSAPQPNCRFNADANTGHGFAILMASVGALQSLRSLRRRLTWALDTRVNTSMPSPSASTSKSVCGPWSSVISQPCRSRHTHTFAHGYRQQKASFISGPEPFCLQTAMAVAFALPSMGVATTATTAMSAAKNGLLFEWNMLLLRLEPN